MRFVKKENFIIMAVGDQAAENSITHQEIGEALREKSFDNAPIIFNYDEWFDHAEYDEDEAELDSYMYECCCGVVLPGTVKYDGFHVTADVMLMEDYASRTYCDGWCIRKCIDENETSHIIYDAGEIYDEGEVQCPIFT